MATYFGLTFSPKQNAFYINVKVTQFSCSRVRRRENQRKRWQSFNKNSQVRFFFSNFDPGWQSVWTNVRASGRRKPWKRPSLFVIFLSAILVVFFAPPSRLLTFSLVSIDLELVKGTCSLQREDTLFTNSQGKKVGGRSIVIKYSKAMSHPGPNASRYS